MELVEEPLKTTIITDTKTLFATLQTLTRKSSIIDLCVAWATSSKGQGRHWKALDLSKIRYAVVGTAFAQTEPAALEDLANKPGRLRLMINSYGTFHPKVVFGRHGDQVCAILGSANFTTAAYTGNTELSVLLEGTDGDPELQVIEAYIRKQWQGGTELTKEWLDEYVLTWKAAKLRRILVPRAKLEVDSLTDLEMSWSTYVELIRKQEGRKLSNGTPIRVTGASPSYMEELRLTRAALRSEPRFENLSKDQRNLLMGTGITSSGFLGSMKPAGYARGLVRSQPEKIGKSLDVISQ